MTNSRTLLEVLMADTRDSECQKEYKSKEQRIQLIKSQIMQDLRIGVTQVPAEHQLDTYRNSSVNYGLMNSLGLSNEQLLAKSMLKNFPKKVPMVQGIDRLERDYNQAHNETYEDLQATQLDLTRKQNDLELQMEENRKKLDMLIGGQIFLFSDTCSLVQCNRREGTEMLEINPEDVEIVNK